jgi:hypothetical protein
MRKLFLWFTIVFLAALTTSCAKSGRKCDPGATSSYGSATDASDIPFDTSVPADQQATLQADYKRLAQLQIQGTADDLCTLGVQNFEAATLSTWLKTRVKLIVGEDFDYSSKASPLAIGSFNPTVYGAVAQNPFAAASNIQTVMMNLGAALYLAGKNSKTGSKEYSLATAQGNVTINGPRVGIIQIGVGLFDASRIKSSALDSEANSDIRAVVGFHEARHSDGNGDNTGFPHAKCPSGDYEGRNACEMNSNGPYAIQSVLFARLRATCKSCTDAEKETMRLLQIDYDKRLLPGAEDSDPRPEALPL